MPGTKRKKKGKQPKRPKSPIKIQNIQLNDNKDAIKCFLINNFNYAEEMDWNKDPIEWLQKKDTNGHYPLFVACQLLNPIAENIFDIYPEAVTQELQWSTFTNPCHVACRFSNYVPRLRKIKKYNPNLIHEIDEYGRTPLFYAQTKRLRWFLREGKVDVNVKDNKGQTAYHYNIDIHNLDYCKEFLTTFTKFTKGNDLDNNGNNPFFSLIENLLDESSYYDRKESDWNVNWHLYTLRRDYPDAVNRTFTNNENMLHYICRNFNKNKGLLDCNKEWMIDNLKSFINQGDNDGITPLHLACSYDHDFIKFLLKYNVNINKKDNSGKTVLHHACDQHNYNAFFNLTKYEGIDIESVDWLENTALHSFMGNMEKINNNSELIVKYILEKSPYMIYNLNKQNYTAMDIMRTEIHTPNMPNISIVDLICNILNNAFNITINNQNDDGNTPLHLLCKRRSLNECHIVSKLLTDPNILVNVRNNKGRTPFHSACYHCNPCMVNQLNGHPNVNIHMVDHNGENALHHLLQGYFKQPDNEACKLTIESLLTINPFFVFEKNKHGETPLYYISRFQIYRNGRPSINLNGKYRQYVSPESNREFWKFLLTRLENANVEARVRIMNYLMQQNVTI